MVRQNSARRTERLSAATVRRIAVQASVDPRTVLRVAAGQPVRGDAGERARLALIEAGVSVPVVSR